MTNGYYFVSRWQAPGPIEDVYDVLADPMEYPRWWPEVYPAVEEMAPDDANGLGLGGGGPPDPKAMGEGMLKYGLVPVKPA